jgi:hypothetical protein
VFGGRIEGGCRFVEESVSIGKINDIVDSGVGMECQLLTRFLGLELELVRLLLVVSDPLIA